MEEPILANLELLVADNIRTLKLPSQKFTNPLVVIFIAPPFSGKTTLATFLAQRLPVALLSEKEMGTFLAPRATFFKRGGEETFLLASKTIEKLTKVGICSIYDASVKKRSDRKFLREIITGAGGRMMLIVFSLSQEEIMKRIEQANAQIVRGDRKGFIMDKELLRYEFATIEPPTLEEHAVVYDVGQDNKLKIEAQIKTLLEAPV